MPRTADMKPVLRRKGRPLPWCVSQAKSLSPTGKKREKWFPSREAGATWIRGEKARLKAFRDKAQDLSDDEKHEAAQAFPIARENGFTVLDAVREKAAVVAAQAQSVPVAQMIDEAIAQLRKENKSARHIGTAKHVGDGMKFYFGDSRNGFLLCSQLTTKAAQEWLDYLANSLAPETLKQYRRYGHLFCELGRRRGYFKTNPFADVHLAYQKQDEHEEITILTPAQVRTLLDAAEDKIKPYLALCAFAGLRPSEAQRLLWSDVSGGMIFIRQRKGISSTRHNRFVQITPNLLEWLPPLSERTGKIYWGRRMFRRTVQAAGLDPWFEDCLRHSAITYWMALHPNEQEAAARFGNSPAVIFKNYRTAVPEKTAREYYEIKP